MKKKMNKNKPGIIRKFFIFRKLDKLTAGELTLQNKLKESMDEMLRLNPVGSNMYRLRVLQNECIKTTDELKLLQDKKKKEYFKLL